MFSFSQGRTDAAILLYRLRKGDINMEAIPSASRELNLRSTIPNGHRNMNKKK